MNDTDLANACVALGVGRGEVHGGMPHYGIGFGDDVWLRAEEFVRDWRVAGALMEKCGDVSIVNAGSGSYSALAKVDRADQFPCRAMDESKPRAIIEATVEALT